MTLLDEKLRHAIGVELIGHLDNVSARADTAALAIQYVKQLQQTLTQPPFTPADVSQVQMEIDSRLKPILEKVEQLNQITHKQIIITLDGQPVP